MEYDLKNKIEWELLEWYKGCVIEYRPGMQRRGYASIYHNGYSDDNHLGTFIHHSLENAHKHIDKLHKDLGDKISITEKEYRDYIAQ